MQSPIRSHARIGIDVHYHGRVRAMLVGRRAVPSRFAFFSTTDRLSATSKASCHSVEIQAPELSCAPSCDGEKHRDSVAQAGDEQRSNLTRISPSPIGVPIDCTRPEPTLNPSRVQAKQPSQNNLPGAWMPLSH